MKFNFLKNDKTTYWDEVILAVIIIFVVAIGVLLIVFQPEIAFIEATNSLVAGVMIVFIGVMFIPVLIYRLATNELTDKSSKH